MSPYEKFNIMTSRKKKPIDFKIYWSLVYGLNEAKSSKKYHLGEIIYYVPSIRFDV
jgi:hypothetical protein